jgi:hypothetical protein
MKKLFKVSGIILGSVILLLIALVLLVRVYENEIKQKFVKELNKYLVVEVKVGEIELAALKKFPNISVLMKDVEVKEFTGKPGDCFVRIREISFQMNIVNFIKKNYTIEKITANNGEINIRVDHNGKGNYHIWKQVTATKTQEGISFSLKKIFLENIALSYSNFNKSIFCYIDVKKLDFTGKFSPDQYIMKLKTKAKIISLKVRAKTYLLEDNLVFNSGLVYYVKTEGIELLKTELSLNEASISLGGRMNKLPDNSGYSTDITFQNKSIDINRISGFLPEDMSKKLNEYDISGDLETTGTVKGNFTATEIPNINVKVLLEDGNLKYKQRKNNLKNIGFNAEFISGTKKDLSLSLLDISQIRATLNENKINGFVKIRNFRDPYYHIKISTATDLKNLSELIQIKNVKSMSGKITIDATYKGKLKNPKDAFVSGEMDGKITFDQAELIFIDNSPDLFIRHGECLLNGKNCELNNFNGTLAKSDFSFDAVTDNLINYIISDNEKLTIRGDLNFGNLDLKNWFPYSSKSKSEADLAFLLSKNIMFDLKVGCKEFIYKNFKASHISGSIRQTDRYLVFDKLHFSPITGEALVTARIFRDSSGHFIIDGIAKLDKMDMKQTFTQFKNFKQVFITDQNIKGTISTQVKITTVWDSNFKFIPSLLFVVADVTIEKGELYHFKPVEKLLGFIKMKKMRDLVFDKIENTVLIKDEMVMIPQMTIRSNAFNISIQGEHSFKNDINYHFKINLGQLFFGKNNMNISEYDLGESDQKGGINLFITMYGTANDPKYKFDKFAMKNNAREGIRKEGKELKNILKKDNKKGTNQEDFQFELEWDDEEK